MLILTHLVLAVSIQSPAITDLQPFLEKLISSEVVLQLDRNDVKHARDKSGATKRLLNDSALVRTSIQAFQDTHLAGLPSDAPKSVTEFAARLEDFKQSLDVSKILGQPADKKSGTKGCCDHDAAYLKLVVSASKTPGINLHALSAPTQYNMWPVLFEKNRGLVYADPDTQDKALIFSRALRKGSQLRKGDVIVAVRGDDQDEWQPISSWKDVLKASNEFETGEHEVFIQVKRGSSLKSLTMISSTVIVNTE